MIHVALYIEPYLHSKFTLAFQSHSIKFFLLAICIKWINSSTETVDFSYFHGSCIEHRVKTLELLNLIGVWTLPSWDWLKSVLYVTVWKPSCRTAICCSDLFRIKKIDTLIWPNFFIFIFICLKYDKYEFDLVCRSMNSFHSVISIYIILKFWKVYHEAYTTKIRECVSTPTLRQSLFKVNVTRTETEWLSCDKATTIIRILFSLTEISKAVAEVQQKESLNLRSKRSRFISFNLISFKIPLLI